MKPSCVIALHGLGASGADLADLAEMMNLSDVPWHFPDAPSVPVTVNGGMRMPAWFDILGFSPDDPVDAIGIAHSAARMQQLIEAQVALGVDADRIVLLGFSQGGVVALHAALSSSVRVGAVVGLSTWLPAYEALHPVSVANHALPIWLGHGEWDNVVPLAAAHRAKDRLADLGVTSVALHTYPMAHSVLQSECDAAAQWLKAL